MSKEIYTTTDICSTIHKIARPIVGADHLILPVLSDNQTAQIFRSINTLDDVRKYHLLYEIFTSTHFGIPNGNRVASVVYDSLDIIHPIPKPPPDKILIAQLTKNYISRLGIASMDVKIIYGDLNNANDLKYDAMTANSALNIAKEEYRKELEKTANSLDSRIPFDLAGHVVYEGFCETSGWAAVPATYTALHEVVADVFASNKFNHGNPNKPLVDIYRLGCLPIGQIDDTFLVYAPQTQ